MLFLISRGTAAAMIALGVSACSASIENPNETSQQAVTEEPEEPAASDAAAAEKPEQRSGRLRGRRAWLDPAKLIEKFDKNGDGVLELTELPPGKVKKLASADTNKDGKLSAEELNAYREVMAQKGGQGRAFRGKGFKGNPAKLIEKFDKNGDGVLELSELPEGMRKRVAAADMNRDGRLAHDELKAHREKMAEKFRGRGRRGGRDGRGKRDPAKVIENLDKNGDGVLELSELPERRRERLRAADTNRDQRLTADELQAHFDARRAERRARRGHE